ncbi:AdoMet-dependent rRNA methyltransferase spb1 [Pseudoscourfieldia marina]
MAGGTSDKKAKGKHRLDRFYKLAKEQGYRSRAAFKLIQLNKQHNFLNTAKKGVMDLCAAPGGWLQVARKVAPMACTVVGVDLCPIRKIPGVVAFAEDIYSARCLARLRKEFPNGCDVVIHDGAPNVGGAFASEAYSQILLSLQSLKLATIFLDSGGWFVTKIFRSSDHNALRYACEQLFENVFVTKPIASRNTSAEIYFVCRGYKKPSVIDPRLLDPKHLFANVEGGAADAEGHAADKVVDVFHKKDKQKKHRAGYEDGILTFEKKLPAVHFVLAHTPVEKLGVHTSFLLRKCADDISDPGDADAQRAIEAHAATDSEIRALCEDLRVLGKSEFKALLKWRAKVRTAALEAKKKHAPQKDEQDGSDDEGEEEEEEEEGEEDVQARDDGKLSSLMAEADARERRQAKLAKKTRRKAYERAAKLALATGHPSKALREAAMEDDPYLGQNDGLFKLSMVHGEEHMDRLDGAEDELDDDDVDEGVAPGKDLMDEEMDDQLELLWASYRRKRGDKTVGRDDVEAAARRRATLDDDDDDDDDEGGGDIATTRDGGRALAHATAEARKQAKQMVREKQGGGLIVGFDPKRAGRLTTGDDGDAAQRAAERWFSQDLFRGMDDIDDDEEEEEEEEEEPAVRVITPAKKSKTKVAPAPAAMEDDDEDDFKAVAGKKRKADSSFEVVPRNTLRDAGRGTARDDDSSDDDEDGDDEDGVALRGYDENDDSDSDDSTSSEEGDDDPNEIRSEADADRYWASLGPNAQAETLAMAKRMKRSKKDRYELLDAGYNRYNTADDLENMPAWFAEDQRKHYFANKPITKEEVEAMKAELRDVDAKTPKKIVEAKMRKKMKVRKAMDAAIKKANVIANNDDMSKRSQQREIASLYSKARNVTRKGRGGDDKKKDKKGAHIVAKKGGVAPKVNGSTGRMVDRRQRADKARGKKADKARKAAGGKKGGRGRR